MKLAELQRGMRAWLVGAAPDAGAASAGLAVYQNNYRAQLMGCLELSFPQLRSWIGEHAFLRAAVTHIDSHPPHAWTLDAYAAGFGATLAEVFPDNPDVHELVWIEHALAEAFVAPDAAPLTVAALATVDWDTARLQLTPSLLTRAATTNADSVWSALHSGAAVPEGEMLAEPAGLVVWRRGFTSCLRQVDDIEYAALLHLQGNGSFAALCDMLAARLGEADGIGKAGSLLAAWLANELITGVDQA